MEPCKTDDARRKNILRVCNKKKEEKKPKKGAYDSYRQD
jgi:hypothetical protein